MLGRVGHHAKFIMSNSNPKLHIKKYWTHDIMNFIANIEISIKTDKHDHAGAEYGDCIAFKNIIRPPYLTKISHKLSLITTTKHWLLYIKAVLRCHKIRPEGHLCDLVQATCPNNYTNRHSRMF